MEISFEHLLSGFHKLSFESQLVPITDASVKLRKIISNGVDFHTDKKSDRIKDIYEGGAKIWECTFDLIDYLYQHRDALNLAASYSHQSKSGLKFLELGCGSALVSCYLSLILADRPYTMYLQDYNPFVIEQISFPNVILNLENYEKALEKPCFKFFAGDWQDLTPMLALEPKFDIIFGSEILYDMGNYVKLLNLVQEALSPHGRCIFATKSYYFGVEGGTFPFLQALKAFPKLCCLVMPWALHGVKRDILVLTFQR